MILKIKNKKNNINVEFFNSFNYTLPLNSIASGFSFSFYFDPTNPDHLSIIQLGQYSEIEVESNGILLITGVLLDFSFQTAETKSLLNINGYSKTGVLEDTPISPENYPLQNDGLNLKQIAEKLVSPYGLNLIFDSVINDKLLKVFPTTTANETQTIKSYLTELCIQRNILLTHSAAGELVFTEVKTNKQPFLNFDLTKKSYEGIDFSLSFNGQNLHSTIFVQKQASINGGNASAAQINNPYVLNAFRPTVNRQTSGDDNDSDLYARQLLSKELRAIKLNITLSKWEFDGVIIRPNDVVSIKAPELFLFKKTFFLIESVNYSANENGKTAILNCVLPEVYNNEKIKNIFYD